MVAAVGAPGGIRTHGLQSRSLTLYPAELRELVKDFYELGFCLPPYLLPLVHKSHFANIAAFPRERKTGFDKDLLRIVMNIS